MSQGGKRRIEGAFGTGISYSGLQPAGCDHSPAAIGSIGQTRPRIETELPSPPTSFTLDHHLIGS
jgi:hypothetical protein